MLLKRRLITVKIGIYLFIVILLASVITSISMLMITRHNIDGEMINITKSLRTQAYYILYEMDCDNHTDQNNILLQQPPKTYHVLINLDNQYFVPDSLKELYSILVARWEQMKDYNYQCKLKLDPISLKEYTYQLDDFDMLLRKSIEERDYIVFRLIFTIMIIIILIISYVIGYLYQNVSKPIHKLMLASSQIQIGQFEHISLDIDENNEIGNLCSTFTQMSNTLQHLYLKLEKNMNDKTYKLLQINRSLTVLYQCSQILNMNSISYNVLHDVLKKIFDNENLKYLSMNVFNMSDLNVLLGEKNDDISVKYMELNIENHFFGILQWQSSNEIDQRIMLNVAQMITQFLYFHKMRKQQDYFLILEERSVIARELHDSLAQVLSYLKIQLSLLKRQLSQTEPNVIKAIDIVEDFEQALVDAYSQLRELLSTFRLTVQDANLKTTLEEVVNSLRSRTNIIMNVECHISPENFDAQDLIHILQIVREAILNAIKHSQAEHIDVIARLNTDDEYEIIIKDDGIGIESLEEPDGHYGLNIMAERASRLNAKLSIKQENGTVIKLTFK